MKDQDLNPFLQFSLNHKLIWSLKFRGMLCKKKMFVCYDHRALCGYDSQQCRINEMD